MSPIAILSAVPEERSAIESLIVGGADVDGDVVGSIDGVDVVVVESGIGKVNAAAATALACERHRPSAVVFCGVAGGLDPLRSIGDVVIGEQLIQYDAGTLGPSGFEIYQAGHVPFFNPTDRLGFAPDPDMLARCRAALAGVALPAFGEGPGAAIVFGTILTGDVYLANEAERERLFRTHHAQAIEMEGAAVAQVAEAAEVDHLVIRSLSDLAGHDSQIDFGAFLGHAAATAATVVRRVLPAIAG